MILFILNRIEAALRSPAPGSASVKIPGPRKVQFSTAAAGASVPKPGYPDIAKRWGHEGLVVVEILIAEDGKVKKAELLESSGYIELDDAALQVVLHKWKFNGTGYKIKTVKEFEFKLRM